MSSLVIVAIPAEDDIVWKVSSEKKPHLTLMYLGEVSENNNVNRMADFVAHALNVSEHGPFYLDVDYRGELGDDKADVLFFSGGWDTKWIKSLRGQLLQQNDIRRAFEAADQFPGWVPHLTLGYPNAPAKEIPDDRKIYSVNFDRIAVWTGDYEGPEFRLQWSEREYESQDVALAYGDTGEAAVADILNHHGVKGMKWGQRKEQSVIEKPKNNLTKKQTAGVAALAGGGAVAGAAAVPTLPAIGAFAGAFAGVGLARTNKSVAKAFDANERQQAAYQKDKKWEKDFKKDKRYADVHNDMADHMNSWLPGHNKNYDGIDLNKNPAKMKEYEDAYFKEQTASFARSYEKTYGSSPSGKYKVSVIPGTDKVVLHSTNVDPAAFKHTANDEPFEPLMTFKVTHDTNGRIVKVEAVESVKYQPIDGESMAQSMERGEEFVLEHASVLDDPNVRDKIKAKIQSILDDVTGDADQDVNLFGDPLVRAKLQSVLQDFFNIGVDKAVAYSAFGEAYIEHIGVKGMRWGHRKTPEAATPTAESHVPVGKRRKTKIEVDGGENHPAHEDAIKIAKAQIKLKRSGPAALSNKELQDVANRLRLEQQVKELQRSEPRKFVREFITGQGKQTLNVAAGSRIQKRVRAPA